MSFYCEYNGEMKKSDWEKIESQLREAVTGYDIDFNYNDGKLTVFTVSDTDAMINDEIGLAGILEKIGSDAVLVYSEDEGAGLKQEGVISQMGVELLDHEKAVASMKDAAKAAVREKLAHADGNWERDDLRMEAAQCLYEEFLRLRHEDPAYGEAFDASGCAEMRAMARDADIVDACLASEDVLTEKFGGDAVSDIGAYDWEYIPFFVKACVDPEKGLREDWKERLVGQYEARFGLSHAGAPEA